MPTHTDIVEYRQPLGKALSGSVLFHVAVFGLLAGYAWWDNRGRETFGSPNAGGGFAPITPVSQIALPSRGGVLNQVAADTESRVPLPPKEVKTKTKAEPDDPDAVSLKGKKKTKRGAETTKSRKFRPQDVDRPGQLYSSVGQAAASNMYGSTSSGSGIGVGQGGTLGTRFGWYADLIREKVTRAWQSPGTDTRQPAGTPAIVLFDIQRDGSVKNVRLFQRSGNYALDSSAERAIWSAAPFQPLPPGYERSTASVELWFSLKR